MINEEMNPTSCGIGRKREKRRDREREEGKGRVGESGGRVGSREGGGEI